MRNVRSWLSLILFVPVVAAAQPLAFPGAQGFGANATGGRAGTVYHVTTLADSGTGSFRDAVSHSGRIIVFDVGGYITISSEVALNDNLTIAGQTAPGSGIGIMGNEVSCGASANIIIRHMRFRPGSSAPQGSAHCLNMYGSSNLIVDHVSFEFGPWNNIGGVNIDKVTIQNCLVADPINQQFGAHIEHLNSSCSCLYNIWANGHNRQPLATINMVYINNTVYNYQAGYTTSTSAPFKHDVINNYFITGPATTSAGNNFYQIESYQSFYSSGNLRDSNNDGLLNGSSTTPSGVTNLAAPWSSITPTIPTFSPASGFRYNVSAAGSWPRDQVDELVVSQVKKLGSGPTGTGAGTAGPGGGLYDSQAATGLPNNGFGTLNGGAPALDTDQDGMPDYWEKAVGLNPSSNDARTIAPDGYANIEHYLNWLADPHALTATNQAVDCDLWQYTSGFTNVSPLYFLDSATNGSVVLINGHIARFTPALNVAGLGSFRFAVMGSDGTAYTNVMTVAITPLPPPSNLVWRGDDTENLWEAGGPSNWLNGSEFATFNSGDNVTFDDNGSSSPAITLTNSVTAGNISFVANQDYTITGNGALVGGGTLYKVGPGNLFINTLNTFSGGVTINEGTVQLGDGVSASGSLAGGITNNDTLIFANPTAVTAAASISGSGTLTKTGAGTLTLSGNQSFTNLTTINAGTLEFSAVPPRGDITNSGVLTFKPTTLATCPGVISGPGSVVVNGSGTVYLLGANTFSGGITNTAGNLVLSNNTAAGTGPVVYTAGSVMVGGGVVITNDFCIPGNGTTDLSMQGTNGAGIWAGNVVNLGSGASWRPGADTGGSLIFTGTAAQGARNFIVPRGTVQFASNALVSATGSATALGRDGSANNRSANITFKDNAVATFGVCSLGGGKSGGSVTVTVQNNAALSFGANNLDLHNVTRNTAVTTLRLNGGVTTVGGFTKSQTTYTNFINFNGGILQAGANNAAFQPALNLQTDLVQAGGARIDDGGFAITITQPLIHDPALGAALDGGLTKLGAGTLTLAGANAYNGPTTISNGTLALSATALLTATSSLNISGGVFDVGALSGGFTLGAGRRLSGYGAVNGKFTVGSGAILAPGGSIGTLTFSNSLTLAPGCTNLFELSHSPLTNDSVIVLGALTNGGSLIVTNVSAAALAANESFKLFNAASYSGSFNAFALPALGSGLAWDTSTVNTNGTIKIVSVTPPHIGHIAVSAGSVIVSGTGGVSNATYYLLGSTNAALSVNQWTPLATNNFDPYGNFSFTNVISDSASQKFYLLKLP